MRIVFWYFVWLYVCVIHLIIERNLIMMYQISDEQFKKICYALTLGDYFVQDQEPSGEQHKSDKETMEDAWAVIREIEVQL